MSAQRRLRTGVAFAETADLPDGKAKGAMKDKNDFCDVVAATKALPPPEKTGCQMAASL